MTVEASKPAIKAALGDFEHTEARKGATEILRALGYSSERTLETSGAPTEFFRAARSNTQARAQILDDAEKIHILFQYTDEEVRTARVQQLLDIAESEFDVQESDGFLFTVVDLRKRGTRSGGRIGSYSRTDYARMTREVNRAFAGVPAVVLFRAEQWLTVGFVARRRHKRNASRDVLERASLIKDINLRDPHGAHIDMLADLSMASLLQWMDGRRIDHDFEGLHAAWLAKLDTEELNRRFYRELFAWFETAVEEARFPVDGESQGQPEEHIIRLITRLMFVWFMKEKGLVAEELFVESQVQGLLRDYDAAAGDSYYRAVLQNLFFATLNTEIGNRGFDTEGRSSNSHYRYRDLLAHPEELSALFERTPFINGGLFECLESAGGMPVDCFTDDPTIREQLSFPNRLFFGKNGLVSLFERYRFTVEENTPIEREVALDPELLGSVFENLLAAYNPETRETARKHTGSYYTPRPVVDYMVRESIALMLDTNVKAEGSAATWMRRIRALVDESSSLDQDGPLFNDEETSRLVNAIAEMTVLDPAVGSGAFPMTALHVLTLALRRLDPNNDHWERIQRERAARLAARAYEAGNDRVRQGALDEVESTFRRYRESDFGRKLYLIQNSLFGVDIQPIACQIAKLRFFISLAIEQEASDDSRANYGVRPLPNLETRFIAADSLLDAGGQATLGEQSVGEIDDELRLNRERHFNARTPELKQQCRKRDEELRTRLAEDLAAGGFGDNYVEKVAAWNPYDQNSVAQWFDPKYMFGVERFDIVIGNPPYIQLQKNRGEMRRKYQDAGYEVFASAGDVYQLFFERGMRVAREEAGVLTYITSNSWLKAEYGRRLRQYFASRHTPVTLVEMGKDVFENAIVDTAVLIARNGKDPHATCRAVDVEQTLDGRFPPPKADWGTLEPDGDGPWMALSSVERDVMEKMEAVGTPLKQWDISIYRGILTGFNAAFIIDQTTRDALVAADPKSVELLKPVLRGRDIARYRANWDGLWLIDTHNGYAGVPPIDVNEYPAIKAHLDKSIGYLRQRQDKGITPYNLRNCAYHERFAEEKLFWMDLTPEGRFSYAPVGTEMYCANTVYFMHGPRMKRLAAFLNSSLITWYVNKTTVTSGMGTARWFAVTVENIPIPTVLKNSSEVEGLVDDLMLALDDGATERAEELECAIEHSVFEAYGITVAQRDGIRKTRIG